MPGFDPRRENGTLEVRNANSGRGSSVKIKSLGWMKIKENQRTLESSFSSVSTATIASKDAFCSIFRDLQYLHSSRDVNFQNFTDFRQSFF